MLLGIAAVRAQDIHFSQLSSVNMLVNPALIAIQGNLEATLITRDQWPGIASKTYRTYGVSVESKLRASSWKELEKQKSTFRKVNSTRAIGLCFYHDQAGANRLSSDVAYLGLNQEFRLSEKHRLYLGLQAGVNYLSINTQSLSYPNQYNGAGFYDPSLPSNEAYQNMQRLLFDVGVGANYVIKVPGSNFLPEKNKLIIGFSAYHLNRARYTFITSERLDPRYNFNVSYLLEKETSNLALVPMLNVSLQGSQKNILLGSLFRYRLSDNSKYTGFRQVSYLSLGCLYRYGDALSFPLRLDIKNYSVGFNYDWNISSLVRSTRSVGAVELMLAFHTSGPYLYQNKK